MVSATDCSQPELIRSINRDMQSRPSCHYGKPLSVLVRTLFQLNDARIFQVLEFILRIDETPQLKLNRSKQCSLSHPLASPLIHPDLNLYGLAKLNGAP